jgi:DNA-binding GntR family transcriptional regulator
VQVLDPIKRQKTLTEQAADAIRARIVEGQFEFGEALSEITLATELGVSKTPVREAFLQLKNEGLVDILPQRGTFVFRMTIEELRQLFEIREILECNSLRFAMRDHPDAVATALDLIVEEMIKATDERDAKRFRRLDADFHGELIAQSRNSFICSAYNVIALRVHAFRNRLPIGAQSWDTIDMHAEVAKKVAARDTEGAVEQLQAHLRKSFSDYVRRTGSNQANVA